MFWGLVEEGLYPFVALRSSIESDIFVLWMVRKVGGVGDDEVEFFCDCSE